MIANIDTKFITLLGKPLSQSFAARMQNAAYRAMGENLLYFYTEVENDHLGDIVQGLRYLPFKGFAVTKPNKVAVLQYLDELDPLCKKMGASNTVAVRDGKLIGYNTDGVGFEVSLKEETGIDISQNTFFCAGAGGAGRAICSILAYDSAKKIYVYDFMEEAAKELVADINANFGECAEYVPFSDTEAAMAKAHDANVLINATGLGMYKTADKTPYPKTIIRPDQICFDATYNPAETLFLKEAKELGCKTINGLGMSLYQGAAQIKIWTGREDVPVDVMRQELMDILAGKPEKNA
ncbi:MAG: shikimate dehydrogenase [Lachnospiraceae bacterium]|nr:shikimate dehydrogenase [Candidatus Minthocola equi]